MKLVIVTILAAISMACTNSAAPVAQNTSTVTSTPEKPQTAIAHSLEKQTPMPNSATSSDGKSKWTQSGDPVDTKAFDTAIASAEIAVKKSPNDTALKKKLSEAYFNRGMELTNKGRQYASALGDFRRAVKNDPSNTEAEDWIKQIIMIYDSIPRTYPGEGEEPPPLPFTKGK